ncbi:methyltransferase domain-containing protein [bacterium]|nr:methyltransferase domain-containing protein [bacterium]
MKKVKTPKTSEKKSRRSELIQTIGPVENLESYVKSDWWREIFNANYLRTDGDVVEDENITKTEIDLLLSILSPTKESKILDVCCGQGRHLLELAKRGFSDMVGLDRSHYLITRARAINKNERFKIAFKEGDARKLSFPVDTFDYVLILGNSFGYFESTQDDLKVLREIMRVLKPGGKLLIDLTDGSYMKQNFQSRSWEWIDKDYFVNRERSLSSNQERLISREVITNTRKGVVADQFYAERLYSADSIRDLLDESGFSKTEFHSELKVDSKRNQDLGMMEKRIIVTASAVKNWSKISILKKSVKQLVVVMGDPGKFDIVKPNNSFDDDDMYTINELKKALSKLPDYKFVFLDQHDTLVKDLIKSKDKTDLVFNLCDEGFNNDATKELHVPSLLEIFKMPYTGGTPQCLSYCFDKSLVRGVANEMDIPTPHAFFIKPDDTTFIELQIDFPVIVKPNFGDSSIGITQNSVCHTLGDLEKALLLVRKRVGYDKPILVEKYLTGQDISVGIIGNPPDSYFILPIIEEDYSELPPDLPKICGYEAKWQPDSPYFKITSIPANISEETERFLHASCIKLFNRLDCRDYARFDWRLDCNQTPRLLEVNPNPGWCWDGHLAKMANLAGISYGEMLDKIIKAAEERLKL